MDCYWVVSTFGFVFSIKVLPASNRVLEASGTSGSSPMFYLSLPAALFFFLTQARPWRQTIGNDGIVVFVGQDLSTHLSLSANR